MCVHVTVIAHCAEFIKKLTISYPDTVKLQKNKIVKYIINRINKLHISWTFNGFKELNISHMEKRQSELDI